MNVAKLALPNIAHWEHFYSDKTDKLQWLGEMFDGKIGIVRKHPFADLNNFISGVGHSDVLNKENLFGVWDHTIKKMEDDQWKKRAVSLNKDKS